ncbi:DNA primase [Simplicispira hankyongi]|uniref:DNA primase n=1 Tax=Simplicispira hankyongi TaxID=2315688 RepID=A0A398C8S2_9BURK|nr:DNA primase [Simplicispira hankyongi]RID99535.1 DNA primase [Simplicispira hankyongi]
MSIPQTFIQELLSRIDVVEVVGRYVPLRKAGANFMGLCPFHGEKSPSFSVSPSKQFFHCFGCGKSGNAIGFLMEHAGMGFVDAVEDLARQVGLTVPDDHATAADKERAAAARQHQATLSEVLEKAAQDYRKQLRQSSKAIDYLKGRGVSGEVAQRYGLGYAPEGWRHLASVFPQYDEPLLAESGLVIVGEEDGKRYDRFRDRVMFPIRSVKGECIGFGGRVLGDDKPKYLNSPETPIFHKGNELYGLFEARTAIRESGFALVTEGYMDVVALAQLGFENAVATLGTACTAEHIAKLLRFTDGVVFSFDGDAAGRRAARKALDAAIAHASDTRSIKFLFLPSEHDPDSFVRAHGASAFSRHIADALPLSRFLIEAASDQCDLGTSEGRARMSSNARALWEPLPDGALKRQLLGELASLAQLDPLDLQEVWQQAAARTRPPAPAAQRAGASASRSKGREAPDMAFAPSPGTRRGRGAPASRSDHAARLLLSHMDFIDSLSHEDNALLCAQAAPHGPLFAWIEMQFHEHGALPWAVLRESLRGHACEPLAARVMTGAHAQTEGDTHELQQELRGLLNRMLVDQIKLQESAAIADSASDPQALQRYRALQARRLALERLAPSSS